jgi:hypothetical protein
MEAERIKGPRGFSEKKKGTFKKDGTEVRQQ